MRYLAPAKDVHDRLDKVQIAGVLTAVIQRDGESSEPN
jgi:hypothetical protein